MPYSKKLKFVHVAIPKTGTTSLAHALSKIQKQQGEKLALLKEHITPEFRKRYNLDEIGDNKPGRAKHLSAIQLKYILGDEEFDACFKFSIVRNSWARMASRYFFTHQDNAPSEEDQKRRGTTRNFHNLEFEPWLERAWKRRKNKKQAISNQVAKLVDLEGNMLVDYVGRLENFQESLDHICDKIGVERMQVPHQNGTHKGHYSRHYNNRTRDLVAELCQADIEAFGFTFEDQAPSS